MSDCRQVYEDFVERLSMGEDVDIDQLIAAHPDHAEALRRLWASEGRDAERRIEGALEGFSSYSGLQGHPVEPTTGPAAGRTLGEFRLLRLLGAGGMGQVWEAEQASLGRRVALKVVRPDRVTTRALSLLAREARAGGRLHHPGLVAVYSHGEDDGVGWIAMELVEGSRTLRALLDESARRVDLPSTYYRDVAVFVSRLADALQAAHAAGVVHRDLKPQNILIASDGQPRITDFGLARITDESAMTDSGELAGTYLYMSPEQIRASRSGIDHRTDVFSLGVVLYEMLALRRPFEGDTVHLLARRILQEEPPDLRGIRSRIPRDLAVICGKCLEKDRERRYATMSDLAADIRRHLASEPILAQPPGALRKLGLWARRNPTRSATGAVGAVAFAVVSLLLVRNQLVNRSLGIANETLAAERGKLAAEIESVKRLSALQDLEDLIGRADALWPAHPKNIDAYRAWIEDAGRLVADLPLHHAKRDELRSLARAQTEEEREADRRGHPDHARLQELRAEIDARRTALARRRDSVALDSFGTVGAAGDGLREEDQEIARLEQEAGRLEALVTQRRTWHFPETEEGTRWWHANLSKLIDSLEGLRDADLGLLSESKSAVSPGHGWSVPRRLACAERMRDGLTPGQEWSERWDEAASAIREHARYGGLELARQEDLAPIGPDPESGLWEFWHVATGDEPIRGEQGNILWAEGTGIVLVLIPGGTFWMGSQSTDESGRNYDGQSMADEVPVHEVTLAPFFLSKCEMTQGQWLRFTGRNPSRYGPGRPNPPPADLLHPVETVSWVDCMRELPRMGLALPTEAQWEFGCRAGTGTPWWTGELRESLRQRHAVNLADQSAARAGLTWDAIHDWPELDDGYVIHSPVATFAANACGLHEVHGNVWEWCLDGYDPQFYSRAPRIDPVAPWENADRRVTRGGSLLNSAAYARSAIRAAADPEVAGTHIGVRPARALRE